MSEQDPGQEADEHDREREGYPGEDSRTGDHLGAPREQLVGLFGTLGQARQALTLLRQELVLPLKRLRLALELKPLAVPNLFQQSRDSFGLFVVHRRRSYAVQRTGCGPPPGVADQYASLCGTPSVIS